MNFFRKIIKYPLRSLLFFFLLFVLSKCVPFRFAVPTPGVVVDSETGRSIPEASVDYKLQVYCYRIQATYSIDLQEESIQTNKAGRFDLPGGMKFFPICSAPVVNLIAAAPGYYNKEENFHDSTFLGLPVPYQWIFSYKISLIPIRYLSDLNYYLGTKYFQPRPEVKNYPEQKLFPRLKALRYQPLGPLGVFVTQKGEHFSLLATDVVGNVYARSSSESEVYRWNAQGEVIKGKMNEMEISGIGLMRGNWKDEGIHDLKNINDTLISAIVYNLTYRNLPFRADPSLESVINDFTQNESSIECLTGQGKNGSLTNGTNAPFLLIREEKGEHIFYEVNVSLDYDNSKKRWGYLPIKIVRFPFSSLRTSSFKKITFCKIFRGHFFIGVENEGIHQFILPDLNKITEGTVFQETGFWKASQQLFSNSLDGRNSFLDIVAGTNENAQGFLYAVKGGSEIYRFTGDGVPDQRIEIEKEKTVP